jgi:hypothetical protein
MIPSVMSAMISNPPLLLLLSSAPLLHPLLPKESDPAFFFRGQPYVIIHSHQLWIVDNGTTNGRHATHTELKVPGALDGLFRAHELKQMNLRYPMTVGQCKDIDEAIRAKTDEVGSRVGPCVKTENYLAKDHAKLNGMMHPTGSMNQTEEGKSNVLYSEEGMVKCDPMMNEPGGGTKGRIKRLVKAGKHSTLSHAFNV